MMPLSGGSRGGRLWEAAQMSDIDSKCIHHAKIGRVVRLKIITAHGRTEGGRERSGVSILCELRICASLHAAPSQRSIFSSRQLCNGKGASGGGTLALPELGDRPRRSGASAASTMSPVGGKGNAKRRGECVRAPLSRSEAALKGRHSGVGCQCCFIMSVSRCVRVEGRSLSRASPDRRRTGSRPGGLKKSAARRTGGRSGGVGRGEGTEGGAPRVSIAEFGRHSGMLRCCC